MNQHPEKPRRLAAIKNTVFVIVTGVVVTVIGHWAIQSIWNDEASVDDLLAGSPISLQRWQAMVDELNQAPENVRDNLFRDYLGERVVWRGYFDQFNRNSSETSTPNTSGVLIMHSSLDGLNSQQLLGPPFVRCFFSNNTSQKIQQLKRGQQIVVKGTLANPTLNGSVLATDLNKCELVAVEDSNDQIASGHATELTR